MDGFAETLDGLGIRVGTLEQVARLFSAQFAQGVTAGLNECLVDPLDPPLGIGQYHHLFGVLAH